MFLVTTADQRFWKTDDKILFLGEWCKTFSQRSIWEKLDYEVLPYHWDDRKQLYEDYLYLDELYEQTLLQMRDILNQIHGVTHSLRYWRIIVGPWLYYFIQILYDRYQSILTAINSNKVTNTLISSYSDMRSLQKEFPWFVKDDCNHYLYSRIIEFIGKMPFDVVATGNISKPKKQSYSIRHRFTTKNILKKLIELYGKFIPDRFNQIVLISSYLQVLDLIRLQLLLKQHPYLLPPDVAVPEKDIQQRFPDGMIHPVSALKKTNIDDLKQALTESIWGEDVPKVNQAIITSARHMEALEETAKSLVQAREGIEQNLSPEFIAIDLRTALEAMDLITGHNITEDILDAVFSKFCIGK